jgi:hypothetical protein
MYSDSPRDILLTDLNALNGTAVNNVNGPGSGNVRTYLYTLRSVQGWWDRQAVCVYRERRPSGDALLEAKSDLLS